MPASLATSRILVIAGGLATAAAAYVLVGKAPHYEWLMFAAWGLLFLPPIVYALLQARGRAGAAPPPRISVPVCTLLFVVAAGALTFHFRTTTLNPDETAYRFQGRVFAAGQWMAEAPWTAEDPHSEPEAADGILTPVPLRYNHHIYQPWGWFVKYPVLFPLALAAGQIAHLEWLVNPLLGGSILLLAAILGRNVFDRSVAGGAVVAALLSPYFLGNSIGFMSHPLCGALVAAAFYFCFRGLDTRRLTPFVYMLLFLAPAFHVRPYTAFLAALTLSAVSLWSFRGQRGLLLRLLSLLAVGGVCIVASVLFYNWAFTGSAYLSPYALYKNTSALTEIDLSPQSLLRTAVSLTRFGLQGTVFSTAPGLLLLAAYALWRYRHHSIKVWALGCYFPLLILGYCLNPISSGSQVGERFWFEGFFGVAILGAAAFLDLARRFRVDAATIRSVVIAFAVAQTTLTVRLIQGLHDRYHGYATVTAAARELQDCRCAVFLDLQPPYLAQHLNLNPARWRDADVFYLIDPGPAHRDQWARRFGFDQWKLLTYDPVQDRVRVE